jgi:small-conductance mechanosensitive channel
VREALLTAAKQTPGIRTTPIPLVYASETSESGVLYKLVFYLDDYGAQWKISDQILSRCLDELAKAGLQPSANRIEIVQESPKSQTS